MLDPQLEPDLFQRDRARSRKSLLTTNDFANLSGVRTESGSASFLSANPIKLNLVLPESDLSQYNSFSLKVINHSTAPILIGMKLVHSSASDVHNHMNISLSGGRQQLPAGTWAEVRFPMESFGIYGDPQGWSNIREIELNFIREKGRSDPDELNITIESLEAEWRDLPVGPRVTVEALAIVLDRDVQHITGLFDPPNTLGSAHSEQSLLKFYDRGNKALFIPPPHPYPLNTAEEILAGRVMGQNLTEISWDVNPLSVMEWTHFLNRHHFLRELVKAIAEKTDETLTATCARSLDRLIESWIIANPVPVGSNGGAGPTWETLTAAWRLREWFWVVSIGWTHEAFRNATKTLMLRSIWEHARHLMDHRGHPNNWIIVESAALALVGMLFPAFIEARQWIKKGLDRLMFESERQFFSDGVHFELSPLYHSICIHALLEVQHVASARCIDLPSGFGSFVDDSLDYLAALARPDFTWPSINDSGSANGDYRPLLNWAGEIRNRPELKQFGKGGDKLEVHEIPSEFSGLKVFPDAGIAIMRSGHDRNANHLIFRAGPAGATHFHQDILSLDVTAHGILRLADPGITSYAPDPLTDYYRSATAHNVILIDGKGPQLDNLSFAERTKPAGSSFRWSSEGNTDVAKGSYKGPWKVLEQEVILTRTVLFIDGEYWIVIDDIDGDGVHEITTCWQFSPGRIDVDMESNTAQCVDARGLRFEVVPLINDEPFQIEIYTGSQRPPRGWISLDGTDVPSPTVLYSIRRDLRSTMAWALIPFSVGTRSIVSAIMAQDETRQCIKLTFTDGYSQLLHF